MKYHPYFRGKQFELILLREFADFLAANSICPIIEPVKTNLSPLRRAVDSLIEHETNFTLITNPQVGELPRSTAIVPDLEEILVDAPTAALGVIVTRDSDVSGVKSSIETRPDREFSVIHNTSEHGKELGPALSGLANIREHIFIDRPTGKLYRNHFREGAPRILVRNSFTTRKNADYGPREHFSDLHVTYKDEGMDGFGDYLIVGDEYSEAGGPAYAVAIHITYLSPEDDMFVYHFVSDQNASPTNPAGKFYEALSKLVDRYNEPDSPIFRSRACGQFVELFNREHFPGLGKAKQISMQHHIELIADSLS